MKFAEVKNAQCVTHWSAVLTCTSLQSYLHGYKLLVIVKFEVISSTQKVSIQIQNWQFFSMKD